MGLTKCCCCIPLRTGVIIIGTLASAVALIQLLIILLSPPETLNSGTSAIFIVSTVASIVLSVLLIVGVYQNRPAFLLPWMIVQPIATTAILIIIILMFVALSTADLTKENTDSEDANTKTKMGVFLAQGCIYVPISFYFFWVVKSFYGELKNGRTGQMNEQVC
jgi:Domain of unknown function (DUF4728)